MRKSSIGTNASGRQRVRCPTDGRAFSWSPTIPCYELYPDAWWVDSVEARISYIHDSWSIDGGSRRRLVFAATTLDQAGTREGDDCRSARSCHILGACLRSCLILRPNLTTQERDYRIGPCFGDFVAKEGSTQTFLPSIRPLSDSLRFLSRDASFKISFPSIPPCDHLHFTRLHVDAS